MASPTLPLCAARRDDDTRPAPCPGRALEFLSRVACATVVTRITGSMADTGLRRVVPSDLYPLVLGFLRDNQLSEVANKFAKATGAVSPGFGRGPGWVDSKNLGLDMLRRQRRNGLGSVSLISAKPFCPPFQSLRPRRLLPTCLTSESCSDGRRGSRVVQVMCLTT